MYMLSEVMIEARSHDANNGRQVKMQAFFRPIRSITKPIRIAPIGVHKARILASVKNNIKKCV